MGNSQKNWGRKDGGQISEIKFVTSLFMSSSSSPCLHFIAEHSRTHYYHSGPLNLVFSFLGVTKMASHVIFQYNVLAIDDTHNTLTNMIVKMIILRLLGSSNDKDKIGVARDTSSVQGTRIEETETSSVQGTRIEETVKKSKSKKSRQRKFYTPVKPTLKKLHTSVH